MKKPTFKQKNVAMTQRKWDNYERVMNKTPITATFATRRKDVSLEPWNRRFQQEFNKEGFDDMVDKRISDTMNVKKLPLSSSIGEKAHHKNRIAAVKKQLAHKITNVILKHHHIRELDKSCMPRLPRELIGKIGSYI